MSISALDSSSSLSSSYLSGRLSSSSDEGPDFDEMAASIVENDDADGDGLLSIEETPLDEDRFAEIDADGDGFISAEELSADASAKAESAMNNLSGQLTLMMQGVDPDEMASSIIDNDDEDSDGLLSLDETPLDEERFSEIDADGDGFISADELSASMEEMMAEGVPTPPPGSETQAAQASGGTSESEESSESEEEYDEYDLNEDGTVSLDELLQAFQNGDSSLSSLFDDMNEGSVSNWTNRMAMEAYQAQMG